MIGKPYSGKLNVRFDDGELEIGLLDVATTLAPYSTRILIKREIMYLTVFDLEQRLEVVKLASRWIDESKKVGVKSVTLF